MAKLVPKKIIATSAAIVPITPPKSVATGAKTRAPLFLLVPLAANYEAELGQLYGKLRQFYALV